MITTTPDQAAQIFQAAYENRYTWDNNFPGLTAKVTVAINGQARTGEVKIDRDLAVEVLMDQPLLVSRTSKNADGTEKTIQVDEGQEWLVNQLRDVVTHRKRKSFADAHGKSSFSLGDTDESGAVEILVSGDAMGSNYRVKDKEIVLVSRVMGRMAFVINHLAHLDTGEGYISSAYNAVFRNPADHQVLKQAKFEDTYEKVGNYYVMTRQVVQVNEQGESKTYEITFSDLYLNID
ncbi:MAG: DUF3386 domain-containing protein [Pseudanabaenaceae cyanobacterium bins.68]|nr:DUF3386 domain-containing protein [Pseudanabaenaceae cyanobacterium bins.68]